MAKLSQVAIKELSAICTGRVYREVDLSVSSRCRIGGLADVVIRPSSTEELNELRRWFTRTGIRPFVIGLTSNLLFADEGVQAPIIQIGNRLSDVRINDTYVKAEAGSWVPGLA